MSWLFSVASASMWGADFSGTYEGNSPAADAPRRVFTLQLAHDGTAIFDTLYLGKEKATQRGRWTQDGTAVTLTFDATGPGSAPRPITFRHRDHLLSPIHWDPSEWGRKGPPVFHRSASKKTIVGILSGVPGPFERPARLGL